MKILIIMPWIRQGGAEIIAVKTAYELQKLGHKVRVAALFVDTSKMLPYARQIDYLDFGPLSFFFKKNKFILYFMGPFFLTVLTLKNAFWADILFPHCLPSYWIASFLGKVMNKEVVWLCNEPPRKRKFKEVLFFDFLMWRISDSFLDKLFVRGIDRIIVYSKIIKKEVEVRYKKEAKLMHLGTDSNFFGKINKKEEELLRRKYNLFGKTVILMVGKLHFQKNQSLGIKVLAKILPKIKNAILVLVGEGSDRKNLELRIKNLGLEDKVVFAGFCAPKEVRAWYGVSDLILFVPKAQTALSNQSFGFIPFEALCRRKVSVVSKNSGASEIIKKEKIGIISSPSLKEVSRNVLNILNSKKKEEMGRRGSAFVKNNLSWEKWGREVNNALLNNFKF